MEIINKNKHQHVAADEKASHTDNKTLSRSGLRSVIFIEFLVPRRSDFAGKPMMAFGNFDCSLRLAYSEEEAKA